MNVDVEHHGQLEAEQQRDRWERVRSALVGHITDNQVRIFLWQTRERLTDELLQRMRDVVHAPMAGRGPLVPNDVALLHTLINLASRRDDLEQQFLEESDSGTFHSIGALLCIARAAEGQLLRLAEEFGEPPHGGRAVMDDAVSPTGKRAITGHAVGHEGEHGAIYYADLSKRHVTPAAPEPKPLPYLARAELSAPSGREDAEVQEKGERYEGLRAWAESEGIDVWTFEAMQRSAMHRYWCLSQVVANRVQALLPLERVGMEMPDANMEGSLAVREAVARFDPGLPESFEAFVIPHIQRAILGEIKRRGFPQTAKRLGEECVTHGETRLLREQALRYERMAATILNGEGGEGSGAGTEPLKGCSKQERIIVLLHRQHGETFEEIGREIGLPASAAGEIYRHVVEGMRGGRYVSSPPCVSAMKTVQGEKVQSDPDRAIHSFDGLPVERLPHQDSVLDLDERFAGEGSTFPQWMFFLSEAHATQCLAILRGLNGRSRREERIARRTLLSFFTSIGHPIVDEKSALRMILKRVADKLDEHMEQLARWIQNPNPLGHFRIPALFSRGVEVGMEAPNLQRIIREHFNDETPVHQRSLLDIGSSDGDLTERVAADLFGTVVAVEPERERFRQLEDRTILFPVWDRLNMDVQSLMAGGFRRQVDVVILSHVLHFLQREQMEEEVLTWSLSRLKPGGVMITVLNDTLPVPGSRAHLLRTLGAHRDRNRPSREYADFLLKKGCQVSVCQPCLRYEAAGPKGCGALRQIMQGIIPDELPNREARLEGYMEQHVRNRGGGGRARFNHTMNIIVARPPSSTLDPERGRRVTPFNP